MYVYGIQGGGYRIKDATATPLDVVNGKVFYNNDGRQAGSGIFKQEKSVIAINNGTYQVGTNYGIRAVYNPSNGVIWRSGGQGTGFSDERVPRETVQCKLSLPTDVQIIFTGWKINGEKHNIYPPIGNVFGHSDSSFGNGVTIGYGYNPTEFYIYWQDANYTNGTKMGWYIDDVGNKSIELFYIEIWSGNNDLP